MLRYVYVKLSTGMCISRVYIGMCIYVYITYIMSFFRDMLESLFLSQFENSVRTKQSWFLMNDIAINVEPMMLLTLTMRHESC